MMNVVLAMLFLIKLAHLVLIEVQCKTGKETCYLPPFLFAAIDVNAVVFDLIVTFDRRADDVLVLVPRVRLVGRPDSPRAKCRQGGGE